MLWVEIIHLAGVSTTKAHKKRKKTFEEDMNQYESLIILTNGYRKAINVTRLTIFACRLKCLMGFKREMFERKIEHERKVVAYLQKRLEGSQYRTK